MHSLEGYGEVHCYVSHMSLPGSERRPIIARLLTRSLVLIKTVIFNARHLMQGANGNKPFRRQQIPKRGMGATWTVGHHRIPIWVSIQEGLRRVRGGGINRHDGPGTYTSYVLGGFGWTSLVPGPFALRIDHSHIEVRRCSMRCEPSTMDMVKVRYRGLMGSRSRRYMWPTKRCG
jgi:hypothetical protein